MVDIHKLVGVEKKNSYKVVHSNLHHSSINFLLLAGEFIPEFFNDDLFALHVLPLQVRLLQQAL